MENSRFKFRVWDKGRKCFFNDDEVVIYPNGEESFFNADYDFTECVVEQCTGLKDKNGKLIYEGDIVTDDVDIFEVVWDYNAWCIQTNNFQHFLTEGFEVIGNIHENEDLLGEKK